MDGKQRWCAWDSNLGWKDGRHIQIHWAIVASNFFLFCSSVCYRNDHRNNHSCGKLKISDELNHEELRINRRPISFVWFSSFLLAIARCLSTTPHPINRAGRKYTSCYITLWSLWWPNHLKLNGRSELRSLTFVWFSSNLFDLERKILIKVFQI